MLLFNADESSLSRFFFWLLWLLPYSFYFEYTVYIGACVCCAITLSFLFHLKWIVKRAGILEK